LIYLATIIYAFALAFIGFRRGDGWLTLFARWALVIYPILLVFVSPVTNDLPRYFLPIAPILALGAARAMNRIPALNVRWRAVASVLLLILFLAKPLGFALGTAIGQSKKGYEFLEITEQELSDTLAHFARPTNTVLSYEVQDRYTL